MFGSFSIMPRAVRMRAGVSRLCLFSEAIVVGRPSCCDQVLCGLPPSKVGTNGSLRHAFIRQRLEHPSPPSAFVLFNLLSGSFDEVVVSLEKLIVETLMVLQWRMHSLGKLHPFYDVFLTLCRRHASLTNSSLVDLVVEIISSVSPKKTRFGSHKIKYNETLRVESSHRLLLLEGVLPFFNT